MPPKKKTPAEQPAEKRPQEKRPKEKPAAIVVLDWDFARKLDGVSSGADLERVMAAVVAKQKKCGRHVVSWWLAAADNGRSDVIQLVATRLLTKKELADTARRKERAAARAARMKAQPAPICARASVSDAVKRQRAEYERLKAMFGDSNGDYPEGYA